MANFLLVEFYLATLLDKEAAINTIPKITVTIENANKIQLKALNQVLDPLANVPAVDKSES